MTDCVFTLLPSLSLPGPILKEICKQDHKNTKNAKSLLFKPVALYIHIIYGHHEESLDPC